MIGGNAAHEVSRQMRGSNDGCLPLSAFPRLLFKLTDICAVQIASLSKRECQPDTEVKPMKTGWKDASDQHRHHEDGGVLRQSDTRIPDSVAHLGSIGRNLIPGLPLAQRSRRGHLVGHIGRYDSETTASGRGKGSICSIKFRVQED